MQRIVSILSSGSWKSASADDIFLADYEGRHRRRHVLSLESGERILLDLKQARLLQAGEGLVLEDGRIIRVESLPEDLMEVRGANDLHMIRLAWHLGNRHLPAMIERGRILIRRDPVIAQMLEGLGGILQERKAPFDPESGAYSGKADSHSHSHSHSHSLEEHE